MKWSNDQVREALDCQLSSMEWSPEETDKVLRRMREEQKPVKKKMSLGLVLALLVTALVTAAVAVGVPGILDVVERFSGKNAVLPEAKEQVVTVGASAETELATFTVTEALYDGRAVSVLVTVLPKDEHTLLVPEPDFPEESACSLIDGVPEDVTLAEYAAQHGYTTLVNTDVGLVNPGEYTGVSWWKDGVLLIRLSFNAEGDEVPVKLSCLTVPFLSDGELDWSRKGQSAQLDFILKAGPALWTATSETPIVCGAFGLRVDHVVLTGSALGVYMDMTYTVTDMEAYVKVDPYLEVADAQGVPFSWGAIGVGRRYLPEQNGDHVDWQDNFAALAQKPSRIMLQLSYAENGHSEAYAIDLK